MSTGNVGIRGAQQNGDNNGDNAAFETGAYAGVLNRAHQQGLKSIVTTLVQAPSDENKLTAIFYAEVVTEKGKFTGIGDASPETVDEPFMPHYIRVAETRAKGRALSDAINRWMIPVEDLMHGVIKRPNGHANGNGTKPVQKSHDGEHRGVQKAITMNQLNKLTKQLEARGYTGGAIDEWLCRACNAETVGDISRRQASSLITQLSKNGQSAE